MHKIFIEKCLKNINNKFELVLVASKKAKDITTGKIKLANKDLKYKVTYLSLKELENSKIVIHEFLSND